MIVELNHHTREHLQNQVINDRWESKCFKLLYNITIYYKCISIVDIGYI